MNMDKDDSVLNEIFTHLEQGGVVPYLGPGVLDLVAGECPVPNSPAALVQRLVAKSSVPHKIRNNLTAAAQYIENFKHRKTLVGAMTEAFAPSVEPTPLHQYLAKIASEPLLIVDTWSDNAMEAAMQSRRLWGEIQDVSKSQNIGTCLVRRNAPLRASASARLKACSRASRLSALDRNSRPDASSMACSFCRW